MATSARPRRSRDDEIFDGRELRQVSRDQTLGQELVDQGVLVPETACKLRWAHARDGGD